MKNPLVSVIITTKNSAKYIEKCCNSVKKQTYQNIEIIVVDNNSKDNSKEIAKKYTVNVYTKGNERSSQRNAGIQKSRGEFILFLDSDMLLSPSVIKEGVKVLIKNRDIVGLYIPEIIKGNSYWNRIRNFERSFYSGTVIDCVRMIRRKETITIGGFDESMYAAEDWDFNKRITKYGKTAILTSSIYHDESGFTIQTYLAKKKYYMNNFQYYEKKWGVNDRDLKKQFGLWYRFFFVFLENGKWKKLLFHPGYTIGMYLLRFLVGLNYLFYRYRP